MEQHEQRNNDFIRVWMKLVWWLVFFPLSLGLFLIRIQSSKTLGQLLFEFIWSLTFKVVSALCLEFVMKWAFFLCFESPRKALVTRSRLYILGEKDEPDLWLDISVFFSSQNLPSPTFREKIDVFKCGSGNISLGPRNFRSSQFFPSSRFLFIPPVNSSDCFDQSKKRRKFSYQSLPNDSNKK